MGLCPPDHGRSVCGRLRPFTLARVEWMAARRRAKTGASSGASRPVSSFGVSFVEARVAS